MKRNGNMILREYKASIDEALLVLHDMRRAKDPNVFSMGLELLNNVEKSQNSLFVAEVNCELALAYYNYHHDFENTIKHNSEAYRLTKNRAEAYKTFIEVCRISGVANFFLGNIFKASQFYDEGIEVLEKLESPDVYDLEIQGSIYFNSTNLYRNIPRNTVRLNKLYKAYDIFKRINYRIGIARCLNSIAIYDENYTDKIESEKLLREAAEIFKELDDKRGLAVVQSNLGSVYCKLKRFDEGFTLLKKALDILTELGQGSFIATCARQIATAHREHREYSKALEYLTLAEAKLREINSTHDLFEIYDEFRMNYAALHQFDKAYDYSVKYLEEYKQLINFDKQSLQSEERIAFELREKEKEAEILLEKNREINAYARQLELINEQLQQFTHIASHDLKEPLRMVALYMQLIEKSLGNKIDSDTRDYMQFAKEGAQRMYTMINSLVTINSIVNETSKEEVKLNEVFSEAKQNLGVQIQTDNATVQADDLPVVAANKSYLIQLFQNLISNGIKFNNSSQKEVYVRYEPMPDTHVLIFKDNGIGIPDEYREKVFEMFQRLNKRDEYEGNGIGLTICRKIVDNLHGSIRVNCPTESGTEIIVELPRA